MIRDYSSPLMSTCGPRQKVIPRRRYYAKEKGVFGKAVGMAAGSSLVLAVCCSLWLNFMIGHGLQDLASSKVLLAHLSQEQQVLNNEKKQLKSRDAIEKRAADQIGIYAPLSGQVVRP